MKQLIMGVGHLHACDVVHLDVKLENAFISAQGVLKLGDFGLAALLKQGELTTKLCGSGVYAAPEVLLSKSFGAYDGRAADVWSLGVCMFVMVRGRFPFHVDHPSKLYASFMEASSIAEAHGGHPVDPPLVLTTKVQRSTFSPELLNCLDVALKLQPSERPPVTKLMEVPWIQGRHMNNMASCNIVPAPEEVTAIDNCKQTKIPTQCIPVIDQTAKADDGFATPDPSPVITLRRLDDSPEWNKRIPAHSIDSNAIEFAHSPGSLRRERAGLCNRPMPYRRKHKASSTLAQIGSSI